VFARRADQGKGAAKVPYEHTDREPFSATALGCHVLVAGVAWVPRDLIEHFMTTFEISEDRARQLVEGYPFHRPHHHETNDTTGAP